MDVQGHVCQCYLRQLGQEPSAGLHLGRQGPPAPPVPSAGHPPALQWWLSMVVSSHKSEAIGGSQATAGLRTAFASGPQTPPSCRSTNHGARQRPEWSQATWSKAGALAAPSRWLWVQGGQEPPQELEGPHSPAASSPRYLPTSPSQSPASITALTLDGGLCWPAARGPCVVPASPRAPLPPEAEARGALAASEHLGEGAGPD